MTSRFFAAAQNDRKGVQNDKAGRHQDDKAVLESQILHSVQDDRKGVQDDKAERHQDDKPY